MKVYCPCGEYAIVFDLDMMMQRYCETHQCPKCKRYATQFRDELGVTYISHYLTKIQELRDESKAAKSRLKPSSKRSNRRSKKRPIPETSGDDYVI